jgi:hypothetical protein
MQNVLCLGFALALGLCGCASSQEFYRPYTLVHPRTGAQVTCGHWVWWECTLGDYPQHGYVRIAKPVQDRAVFKAP